MPSSYCIFILLLTISIDGLFAFCSQTGEYSRTVVIHGCFLIQVKYKENFSKEKGKKPKYDLKEAKIYKTMKDAHNMASEVCLLLVVLWGNQMCHISLTKTSFMSLMHSRSQGFLAVTFSDVVCPFFPAGEIQGRFKETP